MFIFTYIFKNNNKPNITTDLFLFSFFLTQLSVMQINKAQKKLIIFKNKKKIQINKAPNRFKKSQAKIQITYYCIYLTIKLYSNTKYTGVFFLCNIFLFIFNFFFFIKTKLFLQQKVKNNFLLSNFNF